MSEEPHTLDLQATLKRMEPGISVPAIEQSLASIAISLKRIADFTEYPPDYQQKQDMRTAVGEIAMAINNHSTRVVFPR